MKNPLISVIIPFWNASKYLIETLDSVRNQSYPHWELILIDDGSRDSSDQKVREYLSAHRIQATLLSHPDKENKGASASRNLGLQHARGELVCFLDADDVWEPEFLDFFVQIFGNHLEISMAYGPFLFWHSWEGSTGRRKKDLVQKLGVTADTVVDGRTLLKLFLVNEGAVPSPSGVLFRRGAIASVGAWEESFRGMYDDMALYAKLFLSGATCYVADRCLYRYRQHGESLCGISQTDGTYWESRKRYFDWLRQYVAQKKIPADVSVLLKQDGFAILFRKARYHIRRSLKRLYVSIRNT